MPAPCETVPQSPSHLAEFLLTPKPMRPPDLHFFDLQLRLPWSIASRRGPEGDGIRSRPLCLLRLFDPDGVPGYGEAAPVAAFGETMLDVLAFFQQVPWSQLSFDDLEASLAALDRLPRSVRSARAAVDLALHDGAARRHGAPLARYLALPDRPSAALPPTCFSIGLGPPERIRAAALAAERFPVLKLKIDAETSVDSLRALRAVAPRKPVRLDANEAWTSPAEALRAIETLSALGPIEFVEQPLSRHASGRDQAWLKRRSPLPLVADESFHSLDELPRCAERFHGLNLKLSKLGGLGPARQALAAAAQAELPVQLGCMIESSLGIAAALQLAPQARWLDLDGALLAANDPFLGVSENQGRLSFDAPMPGLGAEPRKDFWRPQPPALRPIASRGRAASEASCAYGASRKGLPLEVWLPSSGQTDLLIFACIHGEEPETTSLLSKALRSLDAPSPRCAVVLCANPDGALLGTRGNARGVELNRNFPSSNWQPGAVSAKWSPQAGRVDHSTGEGPASEPETQALIALIDTLRPKAAIALHAPLACVEDPHLSPLAQWLARSTGLPLLHDIGYPTPGSFGSWAKENGLPVVTYELPPVSVSALHQTHLPALVALLRYGLDALEMASLPAEQAS